jgi:ERCC4-type nuclease
MIFVSPEQGSADLAPHLERLGLKVDVVKLDWADVEFAGRGIKDEPIMIGIEVKRLQELTSDYDRFAGHQLPKMLTHYAHRYLVWEGEWMKNRKGLLYGRAGKKKFRVLHGQANASALQKKLITLEMCGGIHVTSTRSRAQTVDYIADLYRWWNDDAFDEHKSHIVHYQPHGIIPLNEFEQAFAGFRNLSTKRARAVSRHFKNSIALASSASAKEWAAIETADEAGKVRKIGDKTATDIVRFLHGEKRA